jgi:hypothetical protein
MVVYRRHTNFAVEAIQQTFNGTAGYGNTIYVTVSRNGDLINRAYMELSVPALYDNMGSVTNKYVNYYGLKLLKEVSVEIGGQQIDKHYSDWLYIWNELSLPLGKRYGYDTMVGADGDILTYKNIDSVTDVKNDHKTTLYVPLEFWFCRNVGLSLPLIALQYHEVKFKIIFEQYANCVYDASADVTGAGATGSGTFDASMWIDYIFLDTDERRRFAQNSQEYLIEQLQFTGSENLNASAANRFRLNFNHPCKELVWVSKKASTTPNMWYNYTTTNTYQNVSGLTTAGTSNMISGVYPDGANPFKNCLLQLNGNDRFAQREGQYFNYVQPYQHHTNIPKNRGINVYSFALKPEEHQPSGTLNMSRIDTAVLSLDTGSAAGTSVNIFAVNYNVLRIMSGMGGLAYSN